MPEETATTWLRNCADSANALDLERHLNLISRKVRLTGIPGFDALGYDDWAAQCGHEFENKILERVTYSGLKLVADTPSQIMFRTFETVKGTDGTTNAQGVEMLIELEEDGQWRLIQERVMPADETAHFQLTPDSHPVID